MFSKSNYMLIPKFDDTEVKNHGFVYLTEDVKIQRNQTRRLMMFTWYAKVSHSSESCSSYQGTMTLIKILTSSP